MRSMLRAGAGESGVTESVCFQEDRDADAEVPTCCDKAKDKRLAPLKAVKAEVKAPALRCPSSLVSHWRSPTTSNAGVVHPQSTYHGLRLINLSTEFVIRDPQAVRHLGDSQHEASWIWTTPSPVPPGATAADVQEWSSEGRCLHPAIAHNVTERSPSV